MIAQIYEMFINKILLNNTIWINEKETKPSHGSDCKDMIQQQHRIPPEARHLAASGCCWVTSEWKEWTTTPKSDINH